MRSLRRFILRLRFALSTRNPDVELAEELESHIQLQTDANLRAGMTQEEARRAAVLQFGAVESIKETYRDYRTLPWFDAFGTDVRYAARSVLSRRRAFIAGVGMLALAVGITTAMFTIIDALVLRPVPFAEADHIASVFMGQKQGGSGAVSPAVFRAWKAVPGFAAVESAVSHTALIEMNGAEVERGIAEITPGIFDLLGGVRPIRGRLPGSRKAGVGSDDGVLISEDVWRTLYDSDDAIIGRSILVDGKPAVVTGVLPSDFRFPNWDTEIWRTADFAVRPETPLYSYVRFAADVPREDALRLATEAAHQADPTKAKLWAQARPLADAQLDKYYQMAVPLLAGGVVLLFLALCANVSSLILTGLTTRAKEFEMRFALGASRGRLIRLAFFESAIIGAGGVIAGTGLAWELVAVARALLPRTVLLRSLNPLNLDLRALGVASVVGLVAVLAAGFLPAILGTRLDPRRLQVLGRAATETQRARIAGQVLVVFQIAISCALLLDATALVRSFRNLITHDRGVDTSRILVAWVVLPRDFYSTPESKSAAVRVIEEQLRTLPGVEGTTWSYGTPPGGGVTWDDREWTPDLTGAQSLKMSVNQFFVAPDFFSLYGIPILRGRSLQSTDAGTDLVISERLATALWPAADPIGHSFTFDKRQFRVIGVAGELRYPSLNRKLDTPQMYGLWSMGNTAMVSMRCSVTCPDSAVVRHRIMSSLPGVSANSIRTLNDFYEREFARPRATAALAFAFAFTGLVAAAAGLFCLLSHSVARRRREIGIRIALGASPSSIRRLVWRDGSVITLVGIGIGTSAGLWLERLLSSLLFDVSTTDSRTWAIVVSVLATTIIAASWRPTRSAVATDPMVLLRDE